MSSTITELLHRWDERGPEALESLLPLVYDQLKSMAARRMFGAGDQMAMQPTELVHEVYLRLASTRQPGFRDRAHFYGVAAALMRRVLVDLARRRKATKRGASSIHVELDDGMIKSRSGFDFELLDRALERLSAQDAQQARVVEMRFFGGLSIEETAVQLGVSGRTVKRDWVVAKAWLMRELSG